MRITDVEDGTSPEGAALTVRESSSPDVLLRSAIPCAGGSPWQNLNKHKPGVKAKIAAHQHLAAELWATFAVAAEACLAAGGDVAIEWPAGCSYWRWPCVTTFIF